MKLIRYFIGPRFTFALLILSMVGITGCRSTRQSVDLTPLASQLQRERPVSISLLTAGRRL